MCSALLSLVLCFEAKNATTQGKTRATLESAKMLHSCVTSKPRWVPQYPSTQTIYQSIRFLITRPAQKHSVCLSSAAMKIVGWAHTPNPLGVTHPHLNTSISTLTVITWLPSTDNVITTSHTSKSSGVVLLQPSAMATLYANTSTSFSACVVHD